MAIKHYTKDGVTVKWQSDLCIHSEKCFHGLPKVFNPKQKPWVNMDGASGEDIVAQVGHCPSGALSIQAPAATADTLPETRIETLPNGPLMVYGTLNVKHKGLETLKEGKATAFCRCGGSENKPFCDGTHKKNGFIG